MKNEERKELDPMNAIEQLSEGNEEAHVILSDSRLKDRELHTLHELGVTGGKIVDVFENFCDGNRDTFLKTLEDIGPEKAKAIREEHDAQMKDGIVTVPIGMCARTAHIPSHTSYARRIHQLEEQGSGPKEK